MTKQPAIGRLQSVGGSIRWERMSAVAEVVQTRENHFQDIARPRMRFDAKYETLKSLARGDVEAFAIRERSTGERLLAYIFPCSEPPEDQPTAQWILTSLAKLAPDAPGTAIALGKYDVPGFAYIVTYWPSEGVFEAWLHRNQAAPSGPLDSHTAVIVSTAAEQPSSAGTMTSEGLPQPLSGTSPAVPNQVSSSDLSSRRDSLQDETLLGDFGSQPREPGEFTRQFFREVGLKPEEVPPDEGFTAKPESNLVNQSEVQSASVVNPRNTLRNDGSISPDFGTREQSCDLPSGFSSKLFERAHSAGPVARTEQLRDPEPASMSSGEFIKLFQVPSAKEENGNAAEFNPAIGSGTESGEFSKVFGSERATGATDPSLQSPRFDLSTESAHGSSTEILDHSSAFRGKGFDSSYTFDAKANARADDESGSTRPCSHVKSYSDTTPPMTSPALSSSDAILNSSQIDGASGGATILFRQPAEPTAETDAESHAGPSEYTRFISREELPSVLQSGDAIAPPGNSSGRGAASAAAAVSPFVTPPAVPSYQVPQAQVPGYPAMPPIGGGAPPAIPSVAPPAMAVPPMPAPAAQPPRQKSYLPLIITLNVLFLIAVLLIVYFALKH